MMASPSPDAPSPVWPEGVSTLLADARRQRVSSADNLPFYHEAPGDAAVLLVHGFSATPWEMRSLGEYLAGAGFTVLGVRLPGHGTTPEDLADSSCQQWLQAVADGFALLTGRGKRVYGLGQSAGALLLLYLGRQLPLAGLVLFSPFLRLRHRLAPLAGLLSHIYPFQRLKIEPALAQYYYDRRPLVAIGQLVQLQHRVRRILPEITAPALVLCAAGDQTADPDSTIELYRRLNGYPRRLCLFGPEVPHVLSTVENPRQAEVFALTLDFLRHLEGHGAA
jgi:carboxylesterase